MEKRCYGCMKPKTQSPVCEHCGFHEQAENMSHQLPMGTVLRDQYEIGRTLGQGGFGITYLAWDRALQTPVAIKEYYPGGMVSRECSISRSVSVYGGEGEKNFLHNRQRFLREGKTLAKLGSIPGIVRVYSMFEENGTAYIVMEYVKGVDLRKYIQMAGGRLSVKQTLAILEPVMQALKQVHGADLVHRDISPDNIMLLPDGSAKLLDFGAVREVIDAHAEKELVQSTEAVLKHGFAPIEQYQKRGALGPWTDIYALCGTIYYCLTGKVPTDSPERMVEDVSAGWDQVLGLTQLQAQALEQGMALRARDRLESVDELYQALYGGGKTTVTKPVLQSRIPDWEQTGEASPEKKKTMNMIAGGAFALVALLALLGFGGDYLLQDLTGFLLRGNVQRETQPAQTLPPVVTQAPTTVPTEAPTTVPETEPPETEAVETTIPPEPWENNRMKNFSFRRIPISDTEGTSGFYLGDKAIETDRVTAISFLDTTVNKPYDAVDFSQSGDGSVWAWTESGGGAYHIYIAGEGGVRAPADCGRMFSFAFLKEVNFNGAFHTEYTTDMSQMFYESGLTEIDFTGLDTSNVTDMSYMFSYSRFQKLNLSVLDTSSVRNMAYLFDHCTDLMELDMAECDTSRVQNMSGMFYQCGTIQTLDLGQWEVDSVTYYSNFMPMGQYYDGHPWDYLFESLKNR